MTVTTQLTGRYLAEYARRPINLVLLVLVPLIFVILTAGTIADFSEALGFTGDATALVAPTAGDQCFSNRWLCPKIKVVTLPGYGHTLYGRNLVVSVVRVGE